MCICSHKFTPHAIALLVSLLGLLIYLPKGHRLLTRAYLQPESLSWSLFWALIRCFSIACSPFIVNTKNIFCLTVFVLTLHSSGSSKFWISAKVRTQLNVISSAPGLLNICLLANYSLSHLHV
jgi:hypothetical protein